MRELSGTPEEFLSPIARVVEAMLAPRRRPGPDDLMVVGAWCRDNWHHALGHTFATAATRDLDLALTLSSWDAYAALADTFPRVGDTGIRFRIADITVDLLPFGDIEDPRGSARPPSRDTPMSVWAFKEIRAASLHLPLRAIGTVRIPTVPGFAAAKLGAWLDRSHWLEARDAADLALVLHRYAESAEVHDRLYDTADGHDILIAEAADLPLAAARLLGADVVATLGSERTEELLARWPGDTKLLVSELRFVGAPPTWPRETERRRDLIDALTRGPRAGQSRRRERSDEQGFAVSAAQRGQRAGPQCHARQAGKTCRCP